jgi:uncharacterized membrane protein
MATGSTSPTPAAPAKPRIESVDLLRGIIMVVMALDHTRDFFHFGALHGADPVDMATTTPWLFFTRWITHFCAPIFSFLAGTGVFLAATRGKSKRSLSWFLITRGLWLIFLELTILVWFGWDFSFHPWSYILATLWALGWSMIVLAGLIHLPIRAIAVFGVVLMVGHNALDGIAPASWGSLAWVWNLLHAPGKFKIGSGISVFAFYPLIPWVGVMAAGYAFGAVLKLEPGVRRAWLWRIGLGLMAAFVALRFTNLYGNPTPWSAQPRAMFTVLSFLDCAKYPPSLCYLLMTLGPGITLLALFDRGTPSLLKPFLVFGRVPFFYYVLHIPLLHGVAFILFTVQVGRADFTGVTLGIAPPPDAGVSLFWVYVVWISAVVALYPLCRWFADLKRRRRDAWLTYF